MGRRVLLHPELMAQIQELRETHLKSTLEGKFFLADVQIIGRVVPQIISLTDQIAVAGAGSPAAARLEREVRELNRQVEDSHIANLRRVRL